MTKVKIKHFILGAVSTNCYICVDEKTNNCCVIDCDGSGKEMIDYININNLTLTHILLTHGHFDHTGAVKHIKKAFPSALIGIGEKDIELLEDSEKSLATMIGDNDRHLSSDLSFKEGDTVEIGEIKFTIIETPGHTKGGICYYNDDIIFTGDTLFAGECGRVDLYGGDWKTLEASLKKLKLLSINPKVCPGHGPMSTLQQERESNSYMINS